MQDTLYVFEGLIPEDDRDTLYVTTFMSSGAEDGLKVFDIDEPQGAIDFIRSILGDDAAMPAMSYNEYDVTDLYSREPTLVFRVERGEILWYNLGKSFFARVLHGLI
jgi:hypothetical protein